MYIAYGHEHTYLFHTMYIMSKITTTIRTPVVNIKIPKATLTPTAQPMNGMEKCS